MSQTLKDICKELKLAYVSELLDQQQDEVLTKKVTQLLSSEIELRQHSKLATLVKRASFPITKTFENYIFDDIIFQGRYDKDTIKDLEWIDRKENIILMGNVGTGKTHMSIALGIKACNKGKKVKFYKASNLIEELEQKHQEGRSAYFRRSLTKYDVLIIDEIGYIPFSQTGSELLFNVIAECYEKQSVVITTNLQFKEWENIFGSNKLTAAMIDRLVHHADIITFTGTSFRAREAAKKQ